MTFRQILLAATIVAVPGLAAAQPVTGPYVSLGAGADFLQNQALGLSPQFTSSRTMKFDPGFAGQASTGWGFGNGLRAEIEGDYSTNNEREIGGPSAERGGGREQQYGGFVNALYDFDFGFPVYPYLGIGAGGQVVQADHFNFGPAGVGIPSGGSHSTASFAYQGIAGVSYPLPFVPGLSATAEYRFVGLLDPMPAFHYSTTATSTTKAASGDLKIGNDLNHEVLFGLRYAFGAPSAPPPPAATPVAAPAPSPSRTYLVFFDWDKAAITDRARQIIAEAAQESTHVQYTRLEVNGYTDLSGTPQYNQGLSVRRADAVAAELVRDGVPRGAIDIHGYGETRPLVATAKGVREPQNRRVEIIIR